jgi:hypothetical protein
MNHLILIVLFAAAAAGSAEIQHRFLAKDESRAQLHYIDQFEPSNDWTIPLPKGCRDIQPAKDNRLLVSHPDGYLEFDLTTQKQLKQVVVKKGAQIESAERLPNGHTVLAGRNGCITFYELDGNDRPVRSQSFEQYKNIRLFRLSPEGHFLFGANDDHVVEAGWDGTVYADFQIPGARHIYWVKKLDGGRAYRVSTGYGKSIVDITPEGTVLRTLGGNPDYHFFSRPFELPNGNLVASHWTGHQPDDSLKGPQLIEFNERGEIVWSWHDPERSGSVHGVIILDDELNRARLAEFEMIKQNISTFHPSTWQEYPRVSGETFHPQALIHESDTTPVDVILRRTRALLNHLNLTGEQAELDRLQSKNSSTLTEDRQKELFCEIAALRRRLAFANPLLDFDSLLFLKHNLMARGESHMVDQYLGINQSHGGGVFRLDAPFSDAPRAVPLLPDRLDRENGSFISLDLDYDADEILFAYTQLKWQPPDAWGQQPWTQQDAAGQKHTSHYCWRPESSFHIYKADSDGENLTRLTDGQWDDFDPVFLPNGRIAFISARSGGNQRCGRRYLPTYTLHGMMPDGSDLQQLSWHDTNEWQPSVNHDGMLIYTRWDYVDRDSDIAHHLWFCYPDGRDPRSMHGNYPARRSTRPWLEMSLRAVPDSRKIIGTAAPHHGESYGSLILIDQMVRDDGAMAQIKRITPLSAFPESETTPGKPWRDDPKGSRQSDWHYGSPWPLSENFYLCVFAPDGRKHAPHAGQKQHGNYGIFLVDCFGNRELIYRDPAISCLDPIPLRARPRPPQIPVQTQQMRADRETDAPPPTGTVAVMNVYEGEYPVSESIRIKELRIINLYPKSTYAIDNPRIGHADQSLARGVLGTVPVEEDGSVYFECPVGAGLYFQLLDEHGMMVQNMRSDTYLHPGERLSCIGCHEDKWKAAPPGGGIPQALRRPASIIQPECPGSWPLSFARLVQPVLDKHPEFFAGIYPGKSLSGTEFGKWGWSQAMHTLSPDAWGRHGGNGALHSRNGGRSGSLPMQEGARVSTLWKKLEAAGARGKLPAEDLRRITLWLDCNSNFYGAYEQTGPQAAGKIILPKSGIPAGSTPDQFIR